MEMKTLGTYVRERRHGSGMTQLEFAQALGIDRSYLSRIETGEEHDLSYSLVRRLARELGISIGDVDRMLYPRESLALSA
jgi:transcriptional regulator with XRE-family HTH domain